MSLKEFLAENDRIESVEVVSFENIPPQFVGLVGSKGRTAYLVNDMRNLEDGTELGTLQFESARKSSVTDIVEHLPGGRALGFEYLRPPGFEDVTGVKIKLDSGDLTITTGDMPYSLFIKMGAIEKGRPEFPIEELSTPS